jgi:hypothetical protein
VQSASRPQKIVGDDERATASASAAEHDRHQLVVAERRRAMPQQLLARAILG